MKNLFKTSIKILLLLAFILLTYPVSLHSLEMDTIYRKTRNIQGGDGITMSIQDADIHSVLTAVARKKGLNIVASPEVKGNISVHLNDASLEECLDAVITLNGFNYMKKGDIIFVTTNKSEAEKSLNGTEVRTFKLNYVAYDDLEEMEENVRDMLSPSAMVTLYKPEKTLIIEDMPEYLDRVEKVLKQIDTPPKQVLIEAKILAIRLNDDTSLGIDWRYTFEHSGTTGDITTFGFADPGEQGLFFQTLGTDFQIFLSALQNQSNVNTLSTPKLVALDKQEAKILVGEKLGYYVTTSTNTATLQSVEFLETGTMLVITPFIMDDGNILMEINPEVSDGEVILGLPSETTASVTTTMITRHGGTIFIGGMIRDRKEDLRDQIPGLGRLPIIGALFGKTTNSTQKTEIIVIITAHIISPSDRKSFVWEEQEIEETKEKLERERSLMELIPGFEEH